MKHCAALAATALLLVACDQRVSSEPTLARSAAASAAPQLQATTATLDGERFTTAFNTSMSGSCNRETGEVSLEAGGDGFAIGPLVGQAGSTIFVTFNLFSGTGTFDGFIEFTEVPSPSPRAIIRRGPKSQLLVNCHPNGVVHVTAVGDYEVTVDGVTEQGPVTIEILGRLDSWVSIREEFGAHKAK